MRTLGEHFAKLWLSYANGHKAPPIDANKEYLTDSANRLSRM